MVYALIAAGGVIAGVLGSLTVLFMTAPRPTSREPKSPERASFFRDIYEPKPKP